MLKNKSVLKVFAIFAVLLVSMYMLTGCEIGGSKKNKDKDKDSSVSSYEEPVKNMIEGLSEANSSKFLKAFPSFISDYMKDIFTDEYLQNTLKTAESEYGKNVKMSYKVKDKKEIDADDLKELEEAVKTNFDKEIKITKGYTLGIEITTKGDDSEDTETDEINVYQIDDNWYLLDI